MLSSQTWPNWKGGPIKDGVKCILDVSKKMLFYHPLAV